MCSPSNSLTRYVHLFIFRFFMRHADRPYPVRSHALLKRRIPRPRIGTPVCSGGGQMRNTTYVMGVRGIREWAPCLRAHATGALRARACSTARTCPNWGRRSDSVHHSGPLPHIHSPHHLLRQSPHGAFPALVKKLTILFPNSYHNFIYSGVPPPIPWHNH